MSYLLPTGEENVVRSLIFKNLRVHFREDREEHEGKEKNTWSPCLAVRSPNGDCATLLKPCWRRHISLFALFTSVGRLNSHG